MDSICFESSMNWQENCIAEYALAGWPVHAEAMKELAWKCLLYIYIFRVALIWKMADIPKTDVCLKISADTDTDVMVKEGNASVYKRGHKPQPLKKETPQPPLARKPALGIAKGSDLQLTYRML